jgi:hypothetical protein
VTLLSAAGANFLATFFWPGRVTIPSTHKPSRKV